MPTLTIEYTTDAERMQIERAVAFVREMQHLGATAAHGTVLDTCERFALDAGRRLLVEQLDAAVRTRAEGEKKSAGRDAKGTHTRTVTTALGPIRLARRHTWSAQLGGCHPADDALGLDGFLTTQARRLLALAGVEHSFDRAHQMRREFCGWTVDAEVIRRTTHAEGRRAQAGRAECPDATAVRSTPGEVEVLVDAGNVNTLDGWRDVKLGVFLKRPLGAPATPDRWASRE